MQTIETFGRLDVLVSNAGVQNVAPLVEFCQALSAVDRLHVTVSANSMPPKSVSLKETARVEMPGRDRARAGSQGYPAVAKPVITL